jgi:hypothetical protein
MKHELLDNFHQLKDTRSVSKLDLVNYFRDNLISDDFSLTREELIISLGCIFKKDESENFFLKSLVKNLLDDPRYFEILKRMPKNDLWKDFQRFIITTRRERRRIRRNYVEVEEHPFFGQSIEGKLKYFEFKYS